MKRSTHHILTTHTGSLPRPSDLVRHSAPPGGKQPVDEEVLAMRVRSAVAEVVLKQAEIGITFLNDGEQGKPGYSTYMKDRLTGFEGESTAAAVSGEARTFRSTARGSAGRASPCAQRAPAPSLGKTGTRCAKTLKILGTPSKQSKPKRYS